MSLDLSLFHTLKIPKSLTNLEKTIETIGAIKEDVIMVALANSDFQALF